MLGSGVMPDCASIERLIARSVRRRLRTDEETPPLRDGAIGHDEEVDEKELAADERG